MAYLNEKIEQLGQAIHQWKEALDAEFSDINRDTSIQRFEFTFELLWKTVKVFLKEKEGIDCDSPKSCFRAAKNIFKLPEQEIEICLDMTDERNLSVHTYSEKMANALYKKLRNYWKISSNIYSQISKSQ